MAMETVSIDDSVAPTAAGRWPPVVVQRSAGKPDASAFRLIRFDTIRPSKIGIGVVCSAFSEQQVQSVRASQPLRHAQVFASCASCQTYFIGKL